MTIMHAEKIGDELGLHINQYNALALSLLTDAEGYADVSGVLVQHRRR